MILTGTSVKKPFIATFTVQTTETSICMSTCPTEKQKKRKKKTGRSVHRVRIPDRVSIHQRPVYITNRTEIGHGEGDTLVGKGRTNGLHTAYERYTSVIRIEKMNSLTADESLRAQKKIYAHLPTCGFATISRRGLILLQY